MNGVQIFKKSQKFKYRTCTRTCMNLLVHLKNCRIIMTYFEAFRHPNHEIKAFEVCCTCCSCVWGTYSVCSNKNNIDLENFTSPVFTYEMEHEIMMLQAKCHCPTRFPKHDFLCSVKMDLNSQF